MAQPVIQRQGSFINYNNLRRPAPKRKFNVNVGLDGARLFRFFAEQKEMKLRNQQRMLAMEGMRLQQEETKLNLDQKKRSTIEQQSQDFYDVMGAIRPGMSVSAYDSAIRYNEGKTLATQSEINKRIALAQQGNEAMKLTSRDPQSGEIVPLNHLYGLSSSREQGLDVPSRMEAAVDEASNIAALDLIGAAARSGYGTDVDGYMKDVRRGKAADIGLAEARLEDFNNPAKRMVDRLQAESDFDISRKIGVDVGSEGWEAGKEKYMEEQAIRAGELFNLEGRKIDSDLRSIESSRLLSESRADLSKTIGSLTNELETLEMTRAGLVDNLRPNLTEQSLQSNYNLSRDMRPEDYKMRYIDSLDKSIAALQKRPDLGGENPYYLQALEQMTLERAMVAGERPYVSKALESQGPAAAETKAHIFKQNREDALKLSDRLGQNAGEEIMGQATMNVRRFDDAMQRLGSADSEAQLQAKYDFLAMEQGQLTSADIVRPDLRGKAPQDIVMATAELGLVNEAISRKKDSIIRASSGGLLSGNRSSASAMRFFDERERQFNPVGQQPLGVSTPLDANQTALPSPPPGFRYKPDGTLQEWIDPSQIGAQ